MIFDVIDQKIRRAFSSAAMQYDVLSSLHKEIGRELIKKIIDNDRAEAILDVGMGTGSFTKRISFYFPESTIVGLDSAAGMIDEAKKKREKFHIVQGDAQQLPFKPEAFDIITSNLAYQWVYALSQALQGCHRCLRPEGVFHVTMFGFDTFKELFASLEYALDGQGEANKIKRLATRDEIKAALVQAGFRDIHIDYELIKAHFPTMMDLLKWIKDIGANALPKDLFIGKDLLQKTEEFYNVKFKDRFGIYTTFEVVWVKARK